MPRHGSSIVRLVFLFFSVAVYALSSVHNSEGTQAVQPPAIVCSPSDYVILAPNAVAIKCDVQPTEVPTGGQLVLVPKNGQGSQITDAIQVVSPPRLPSVRHQDWLIVYWMRSAKANLTTGASYVLTLQYAPVNGGASPVTPPLVIQIDTTPAVTLLSPQKSAPLDFLAKGHIAFSGDSKELVYEDTSKSAAEFSPCIIKLSAPFRDSYALSALCERLIPLSPQPTLSDFKKVNFTAVGYRRVKLGSLPGIPIVPTAMPGLDVLGGVPTFDKKSRFARQNAPATKDASQFYLNVNYAAGVRTVPGWVLDGKYAPPLAMYRQFTLSPLLLADVGNNSVQGQTYTNTVDLGGTAQRVFRPGATLLAFTPGVNYETDKQFDRDNLLATIDSQYFFKGLYKTQQQQCFSWHNDEVLKNKAAQLSDCPVPIVGYGLDFHAGIQPGGALVDSTVHASKGSATEVLPSYSIFRLVPQVHFLVQLWRFSFDESVVGYYLATTENTIVQTPFNSLYLKRVQGWKGVNIVTNCFALDPQGNFNVTVTYKDGFSPPTWKRVNAVQAGILIKY